MKAIFKRECAAYFTSPIGYVYLTAFCVFAGYYLFMGVLIQNRNVLTPVFSNMINIVMVLMPLLTMRLMTEDRRSRTDQLLLTAPVTLWGIALGKFFAAAALYALGLSVTLVFGAIISFFSMPNWGMILGNFIALLLLGLSFIAIGQFISATTENQATAAIGSFAAMLALFLLDALPSVLPHPGLSRLVAGLSFLRRYAPIANGILSIPNLLFFLSACAIFLFLTTRVLEKRRWG